MKTFWRSGLPLALVLVTQIGATYSVLPDGDTWLHESNPTENNRNDDQLACKAKPNDRKVPLYHWNLAGIPAGSVVTDARIEIYVENKDDEGLVAVHRVLAPWTETGATWQNRPAYAATPAGTLDASQDHVTVPCDLDTLVQGWIAGTLPNHGLLLLPTAGEDESKHRSRETSNASEKPRLVIVTTPTADLALTQLASTSTPAERDTVRITLTLANAGPDGATGIRADDVLPSGFLFQSAQASQGSYAIGTGQWTVGSLASGASATLTLTVTVATGTAGTSRTNTATVAALDQLDPEPANNADSLVYHVRTFRLASGSYAGDGLTRAITGIGFRPDVVIVKRDGSSPSEIKLSTMGADTSKTLGPSIAMHTGYIPSLDADGFTVTNNAAVNTTGSTYYWIAIQSAPGALTLGTYVGDGAGLKTVTGLGLAPVYVAVLAPGARAAVQRFASQSNSMSSEFRPGAELSTRITGFVADGFQLGSHVSVNEVGVTFYYLAVRAVTGQSKEASYLGDATDNRNLGGLGFSPGFVTGRRLTNGAGNVFRTGAMFGDYALPVDTGTGFSNAIQSFLPDGFQIGRDASVNELLVNYVWLGLRDGVATPQPIDLALAKTVDVPTAGAGDTVTFHVTLSNLGPGWASGVVIRDLLPAGLALAGASASQGAYLTGSGLWMADTLSSGGTASLFVTAVVDSGTAGSTLTNVASVLSRDQNDPVAANDSASAAVTITASDLLLTKTVVPGTASPGDTATFTLTVRNAGPSSAAGVLVADLLPSGLTFLGALPTQGSYDSGAGSWTVGSIAAGDSARLVLQARVAAGTEGTTVVNTALASASQADPDTSDNRASASVRVLGADLAVTKTAFPLSTPEGDTLTYTVRIKNLGPDPAQSAAVTDSIPTGSTFVDAVETAGTYSAGLARWSLPALAVGDSATLVMRVRVSPGMGGYMLTNTAFRAASSPMDPSAGNDTSTVLTYVGSVADLALRKTASTLTPNVGDTVLFTVTLVSRGPSGATGIAVRDSLPAGLSFLGAGSTQGTYSAGTGRWTIPAVAAGDSARLTMSARVLPGTSGLTRINEARVDTLAEIDPDPANDLASVVLSIRGANLAVLKTADRSLAHEGDTLSFRIVARNLGPTAATGVDIQDALPAGLTFLADSVTAGDYAEGTSHWSVPGIAAGDSAVLWITARLNGGTGGTSLTNRAYRTASAPVDEFPANDSTSAAVDVVPVADLALQKTVTNATPLEGDTISYAVTLTNRGPAPATGVVVTDLLPTDLALLSAVPQQGSYAPGSGAWTVGSLASLDSLRLVLQARVGPNTSGMTLVNTALVTSHDQDDFTAANDTARAGVFVRSAELHLDKSVDLDEPAPGDTVTFTVGIHNHGPSAAGQVRVSDVLPAGLSFLSATPDQGTYQSGTGVWTVGSVPDTTVIRLLLRAVVDPGTAGTHIENEALILSVLEDDPDTTNNRATASLDVRGTDLALTKTVDRPVPLEGDTLTYRIRVRNLGPEPASSIEVQDPLPAGLAFVSASATSGAYVPGTGRWTFPAVAVADSAVLTLRARLVAGSAGTAILNRATLTGVTPRDVAAANDTSSVTVNVVPRADLALQKSVSGGVAGVGDTVTYTIHLRNLGPAPATGVEVTDLLPSQVSFVASQPEQGVYVPGTGRWTPGTIAVLDTLTLRLTALIHAGTEGQTVVNTAQLTALDQDDANAVNDAASASFLVDLGTADLRITKSAAPLFPSQGDTLRFTIDLANDGPDTAHGVIVEDLLTAQTPLLFQSPTQGTYTSGNGKWTIGDLAPGRVVSLLLATRVAAGTAGTQVGNTARVLAQNPADPDTSDNRDSVLVPVKGTDLAVTKDVNALKANLGDTLRYVVTLENRRAFPAASIQVTDVLPAGLTVLGNAPDQGSYVPGTGIWSVGSLAGGATTRLVLTTRIAAGAPGATLMNIARVTASDSPDLDTANDRDTTITRIRSADLSLLKTADRATAGMGDTVHFTVQLGNAGPDTSTGIAVTDLLPAGLVYVSHSAAPGAYVPGTGAWGVGSLPSGGSATLSLFARVAPGTLGSTLRNIASVTATSGDPAAANHQPDTVSVRVPSADLRVTKTGSPNRPRAGDTVSFIVRLKNAGPDSATGIALRDVLPAQLTYMSHNANKGVFTSGTGVWLVGSLAAGDSARLDLTTRVASGTIGLELTNRAFVQAVNEDDPDTTTNTALASVVVPGSDLTVEKSVDADSADVGDTLRYELVARNLGPDASNSTHVDDAVPTGLIHVSSQASHGNYAAGSGQWVLGNLAAGDSAFLSVLARVDTSAAGAWLTNRASFMLQNTDDPNLGNNRDSASVWVRGADLALAKIVDQTTAGEGDTVRFTVTLTNRGPDGTTGVQVGDTLTAGLALLSTAPSRGAYAAGTKTWTVGTMAVGDTATLEMTARVLPGAQGSALRNTAWIKGSDIGDAARGNNVAQASLRVPSADLRMTKIALVPVASQGDTISFRLTVQNAGPDTTTGAAVDDVLPTGLVFVSASPSRGAYTSGTGRWTVGTVAPGDSATLVLAARVGGGTLGTTLHNVAHALGDLDDPALDNNTDTASVTVPTIDLFVRKTVSDPAPSEGDTILYIVTAGNRGPDLAHEVAVADTLPAGAAFLSALPSTGSYSAPSGAWTVGTLAAGDSATLRITVRVGTGIQGTTIVNRASVAGREDDPVASNNTASVSFRVPSADLVLVKTVSRPFAGTGDTLTYRVRLANLGPDAATGILVRDPEPVGLSFLGASASRGSMDVNAGLWTVGTVASGDSAILLVTARVDAGAHEADPVNRAWVSASDQMDPAAGNDSTAVTVRVEEADLALQKIVLSTASDEGDTARYRITVKNRGPDPAGEIGVIDLFPAGLIAAGGIPSQGTFPGNSGPWTVGALAAGDSATLLLNARIGPGTAGQTLTNTVHVLTSDHRDPAAANDTARASVLVSNADLAVTLEADTVVIEPGNTLVLDATLLNRGPDAATEVRIEVTLPPGVATVSGTPSAGAYDSGSGSWTVGALSPLGTATLRLTTSVGPLPHGTVLAPRIVVAALDQGDPIAANDTARVAVTVKFEMTAVLLAVTGATVLPGQAPREVCRLEILNTSGVADSLGALTVTNATSGPGNQAALDSSWTPLTLHVVDGAGGVSAPVATASFSGGRATFGALAAPVPVPAHDRVVLSVWGGPSLRAHDGDVLDVSVAAATDVGLLRAHVVAPGWPQNPSGSSLVDGMSAAQISVTEGGGGVLLAGAMRQHVWTLRVPANGYAADVLQRFDVENLGTARAVEDLSRLELWADADGDAALDVARDTRLGQLIHTGSRYEITGLSVAVSPPGRHLFLTADVAAQAAPGATLRLSLPDLPDVAFGMASANDGPRDASVASGAVHTVTQSDRIALASLPTAGTSVRPGARDVVLLRVAVTNTYAALRTLSRLAAWNASVAPGATATERDALVDRVTLAVDRDENGAWSAGDSFLVASTFTGGAVDFAPLAVTLPPGVSRHLLVLGDVSLTGAADGDSLAAALLSAFDLAFTEEPAQASAAWPLAPPRAALVDGLVAAQVALHGVPPTTLGPNQGPERALDVTLPGNGYAADVLQGLRIGFTGSADPAADVLLSLHRDDGDGVWEPASDADLGPLTWTGTTFTSLALNAPLAPSGTRFFVALSTPSTTPDSATVRLSIPVDGIQVESRNDGPIDAGIANPHPFILSSAPLIGALSFTPEGSAPGLAVTLRLDVTNTSQETLSTVTPSTPFLSGDPGTLAPGSGPFPASATLAPGASVTFTWNFTGQNPGTATASASAQGTGRTSGLPQRSLTLTSPPHRVYAPVPTVALFAKEAMPPVVPLGSVNLAPLTLTFTNTAGASAADVLVNRIRIQPEVPSGQAIAPDQLLARVRILEGQISYADVTALPASGPVILDLVPPVRVTPQEPVSLSLRLDLLASAPVGAFRLAVRAAADFGAENAVTGAAVPVVLPDGAYPILTGVATLVAPAQTLAVGAPAAADVSAEPGQAAVPLMTVSLNNATGSSLPSEIRLLAFTGSLVDAAGALITDPASRVSAVTVRSPLGQDLATVTVDPGHADSLVFTLSPPWSVPANAPSTLTVLGTLAPGAAGDFRFRIERPGSVSAHDPNAYRPVPAVLDAVPLDGPAVRIVAPPTALRARGTPALPPELMQGHRRAVAVSGTLRHPDTGAVAPITIASLTVSTWDQSRTSLAPDDYLDRLTLLVDGVERAVLTAFPTTPTSFTVPVSSVTLDPGESVAYQVLLDFEADAPLGTFELALLDPAFAAMDAVTGTTVTTLPEAGGNLPFVSGLARLSAPPREAVVTMLSLLPPLVAPRPDTVAAARLTIMNPSPAGSAPVPVTEMLFAGADANRAAIPLGRVVERITMVLGDSVLGSTAPLAVDASSALLTLPAPVLVSAGQSVSLTVTVTPRSDPGAPGFRLTCPAQSLGVNVSGFAVSSEPEDFPLMTEYGQFANEEFAESFTNFPNPFAAGREHTTFTYYLPQAARVSLRIYTPRGETVLTLLDGVSAAEGLQQISVWDGRNGEGTAVRNGVYLAELVAEFVDGTSGRLLRKLAVVR